VGTGKLYGKERFRTSVIRENIGMSPAVSLSLITVSRLILRWFTLIVVNWPKLSLANPI
jgi:hypothetical protein